MGLNVCRYKENEAHPYYEAVKFWSNGCGELHHHGEYDITEDELPTELQRAYQELYNEGVGYSLRYLVDTPKGYGVALINEYDTYTAESSGLTMEALFETVVRDAEAIAVDAAFRNAEVYVGEFGGFDDCHDLTVVFPWDTPVDEFCAAVKRLDEMVYRACGLSQQKTVEEQLSDAGVRSDMSVSYDGGRLSPHELRIEN